MNDVNRATLEPRHYVGIRRKVPVTELQPYFAEVLPKVMGWLAQQGIAPASMPMAMWHAMDMTTSIADVQAGCFVAQPVAGDGEITGGTTPATEALTLTHVGGYDKMGQSWGRVFAKAGELGVQPGAGWEIYVDDPGSVDEAVLRTEITLPVTG